MNKKAQIPPQLIVIIAIFIIVLIPLINVNYVVFSISDNQISEPSYQQIKKSVASYLLESIEIRSSGAYDVELKIYDLESCPNYERTRNDISRQDCNILFSKNFTSISGGTHYMKIDQSLQKKSEIYLTLKRTGEVTQLSENYGRIEIG